MGPLTTAPSGAKSRFGGTTSFAFNSMAINNTIQQLAISELYAWLKIAQEDLHEATNFSDELEAEAMCDAIVSEIIERVAA